MTSDWTFKRRDLLKIGGAVAVSGAVAGVVHSFDESPPPAGERIRAKRVPSVDIGELHGATWQEAIRVPLLAQQVAPPTLATVTVPHLDIAAAYDDATLAVRLRWDDPEPDQLNGLARFQDAVAVQLPLRRGTQPPITMGGPGQGVHVLQWRASWQRDIDEGRQTVADVYPRVVRDLSPADVLPAATAATYSTARAVGNPMSALDRTSPVEEMVAEGFGSLTHLPRQRALGHGVHGDGRWTVAIGIPRERADVGDPLADGAWPLSFAVWSGGAGNRGGRKHYANWIQVVLG